MRSAEHPGLVRIGPSKFEPAKAGADIEGYAKKGVPSASIHMVSKRRTTTSRRTSSATQLDPPGHWRPKIPRSTSCRRPTRRPLVVISIVDKVAGDPGYHLQVADIEAFEQEHGQIPEGSVVFVRSDWSKTWPDPALATTKPFPGVSLDALKFLHEQRHILFHGHEPLDTDTTPNLEGEYWLMHNGYAQAEGVANLDGVPETDAWSLSVMQVRGWHGRLARYVAICPPIPGRRHIGPGDAPLPKSDKPLHWTRLPGRG